MRMAFVTPWDIGDPRAWSGVVHRMYRSLAARTDVVPVVTKDIRPSVVDRVTCRFCATLGRCRYLVGHAVSTSRRRARALEGALASVRSDVVLAVVASQDVAFLRTELPVVSVSDATFHAIRDYYPLFSELCRVSSIQGEMIERRSLEKSLRCVFASDWAQHSALADYSVPAERCRVIPFGPGLEPTGPRAPRSLKQPRLRMLAVAGDWTRKGGDLVLEVVDALARRGLPVSLTLVGEPPIAEDAPPLPPSVTAMGRVGATAMVHLYEEHDIVLELARATCTGITLTDAAAFGLPVIATRTGGVSTVVEHGVTGFLVDEAGELLSAVEQAVTQLLSEDTYARMSAQARQRHERQLNWDEWARELLPVVEDAAAAG